MNAPSLPSLTRLARVPGVTLGGVTLDPTVMSTRMRNAVQKMLKAGVCMGSVGSNKTITTALALGAKFGVPIVHDSGYYFVIPGTIDPAIRTTVADMLQGDMTKWLLTQSATLYGRNNQQNQQWRETHKKKWEQEVRDVRISTDDVSVSLASKDCRVRIAEEMAKGTMDSPAVADAVSKASAALMGSEPIVFTTEECAALNSHH